MPFAVVTGANRGLGLEFCRQLRRKQLQVLAACRNVNAAHAELGVEVSAPVDVTQPEHAMTLKTAVGARKIDLLIHNAGVLSADELESVDPAEVQRQFTVNALGPLLITLALRDNLQVGSKIAIITSLMGSMDDNSSGGYYGYRMSKAALNAFGVSLARDLSEHGIHVTILHPGYVRTDMTQQRGNLSAAESVAGMLGRIDELNAKTSGRFFHANGRELPW